MIPYEWFLLICPVVWIFCGVVVKLGDHLEWWRR